ncbi:unnamed protein product, partial [Effrenium voratum]
GSHGDADFVELDSTDAVWSPVPVRHEAGIAAWLLQWQCQRCARAIPAGNQGQARLPPEAHSRVYVPFLLAAASLLQEEALRAWSDHPAAGAAWGDA